MVESGVFDKDVFSIVDTGTTITIVALKNDTALENFDMGFNGSISSSKGKARSLDSLA